MQQKQRNAINHENKQVLWAVRQQQQQRSLSTKSKNVSAVEQLLRLIAAFKSMH